MKIRKNNLTIYPMYIDKSSSIIFDTTKKFFCIKCIFKNNELLFFNKSLKELMSIINKHDSEDKFYILTKNEWVFLGNKDESIKIMISLNEFIKLKSNL